MRCCNHCGCSLTDGTWAVGNVRKNNYICRACDGIKSKRNRLRRKARLVGLSAQREYSKVKSGYVYTINNPAWPDWVKVGMAIDAEDRCNGYQTSSPYRDYELHHSVYCDDRRSLERDAHNALELIAEERRGEWFKIPVEDAVSCITDLLK